MNANIIGAARSGISLLGAILDCPMNSIVRSGSHLSKAFDKFQVQAHDISLLSITPEHLDQYGYSMLDGMLLIKETNTPFIWMVRDPIVSVCSYVKNLKLSIKKSFEFWFITNQMLWYLYSMSNPDQRCVIRMEELLLNPKSVKKAFHLVGLEYNDQFIRYGDFDHQYPNVPNIISGHPIPDLVDTYPKSREVQDFSRRYMNKPIMKWLGYHKVNVD